MQDDGERGLAWDARVAAVQALGWSFAGELAAIHDAEMAALTEIWLDAVEIESGAPFGPGDAAELRQLAEALRRAADGLATRLETLAAILEPPAPRAGTRGG